jgi:hypothetical protein
MKTKQYIICALWALALASAQAQEPDPFRTYDTSFLDETMRLELNYNKVRGASIAFFDKVSMTGLL